MDSRFRGNDGKGRQGAIEFDRSGQAAGKVWRLQPMTQVGARVAEAPVNAPDKLNG